MTSLNTLIRSNIVAYMNGEVPGIDDDAPGKCLKLVRQLLSGPLNIHPGDATAFYDMLLKVRVEGNDGSPWARSMQRSLRTFSFGVPFAERTGGDLVFNHRLAREGHVVLLLNRDICIENTGSARGYILSGYNRLSNLDEQPYRDELEVFRLPLGLRKGAK